MQARAAKRDTGFLEPNVRPAHSGEPDEQVHVFTHTLPRVLVKAMGSHTHQLTDLSDKQNLLNERHIR